MKAEDIFDGVTDIRDDLIKGAKAVPKGRKFRIKPRWLGAIAAVLVVTVLGGIFRAWAVGWPLTPSPRLSTPKWLPIPPG